MQPQSGLTIRQHVRRTIELPVEFIVSDVHRAQVRFSPSSAADGQHVLKGHMSDVSSGGMGLTLRVYVPRMCEATVRVFDPRLVTGEEQELTDDAVIFEHQVKVRRVYMTSHDPTYGVGVSFVNPQAGLDERIHAMQELGRAQQELADAAEPPAEAVPETQEGAES